MFTSSRKTDEEKKNSLSNELFYEIFDYLNGYHIYQAFSNLNTRFESLVNNPSYPVKVELLSKTKFDSEYKEFLYLNKHRLTSFYFDNEYILDQFITFSPMHLLFVNIQSICITEVSAFQLLIVLFYLKSSSRLSSLTIYLNEDFCDLGEIYRIIFHLPTLKHLEVGFPDPSTNSVSIVLPMAITGEFSLIERLTIYHDCKFNELINILSYTPRLLYLNCSFIDKADDEIEFLVPWKLSNLTHLTIGTFYVNFDEIEMFLLALCSQLKFLEIDIRLSKDENCIDADRWERLISQHMPSLDKFIFSYSDTDNKCNHMLINRFTSSFWIQRNWLLKISLWRQNVDYSIQPKLKKSWYDFQEPTGKPHFPSIQLTARGTMLTKDDECSIDRLNSMFDVIQISYLNIHCNEMCVHTFIKILNRFPNLTAIRITGLQSYEEYENLKSYDKITKLTLRKDFQIDIILHLFPCLQYLSLQYISNHDIESIIRNTLLKITKKNVNHPMTLCIFGLKIEYDKVQKINQMIKSENLLNDYTINRQFNRFYLQWK